MAYSGDSDLIKVAPLASSWAVASLGGDPTATWDFHRQMAYADINNQLRGRTAIPVSTSDTTVASGIAEAEALLTASRLMKANLTQFSNSDAAFAQIRMFDSDAKSILANMYFPASVTTPTSGTSFVGNGTISVSVDDSFAYRATFVVQCTTATPVFVIKDNRPRSGGPWTYEPVSETQWPSDTDIDSNLDLRALSITIATGTTAFDVGDYWTFEVFPNYKMNRKGKLGWVPLVRA